jgi:hypothetical protein
MTCLTALFRRTTLISAAALVLAAATLAVPAKAAPIAYQLDLTVTANAGNAFGIVGTGGVFTATVDLDPTISFTAAGNATNFYLDLNGSVFQTDPVSPAGATVFIHGANTGGTNPSPFGASDPNNFKNYLLRLNKGSTFGGPTNALLDGIAISGSSADDITWGAYDASTGATLTGTFFIAIAPQVAVPAPGALALLGLGFAGIGLARRRRTV